MAAWIQQGFRLDMALAVAFEVAILRMNRADSQAERGAAIRFNHRLWRVAGQLAPTAPLAEDRNGLVDAAATVHGLTQDDAAALNARFARVLAGRAATQGALRQILADWRNARTIAPEAEFGDWLVTRLEGFMAQQYSAWAA
ncbi:MAG: hypothetical protein H7Z12_01200 [Rhodospirillaceae bacterium]|nr:hypothetical protein [Rhodospirillales bacterium]